MVEEDKKEITLIDILKDLKGVYGEELLSILLTTDIKSLRKWITGKAYLNDMQKRQLSSLLEVHSLLSYLPAIEERTWFVEFDDYYLYGYPAEEFRIRPSDVRVAAIIKRGQNDM